ncbi:MAG: P-loop NTPase fold protein [Myxococcota bacterium]|jgi:hypothetical protein|nr:P-loop NTPase fold protein [Myxococcota bacterium]
MEISARPQTTFPDVPLDGKDSESVDNCLGLDDHARALAKFISGCETPMTIGIQGDWGSGKTSLMRLIEANLEKQRQASGSEALACLSVRFNTWQYSQLAQRDRLPIAMMWNLTKKLQDEAAKTKGWPSANQRAMLMRFAKGLARAATIAAASVATGGLAGIGFSLDGEKLVRAFEGQDEQIDDANLFEKLHDDFAAIVDAVLNSRFGAEQGPRVVFYIDDLDRLEPTRAVELLEVIKNFLDVPRCVFVLAIDYEVIIKGLKQRATSSGEGIDGKSFFDKIIQLPYRMPTQSYNSWNLFGRRMLNIYKTSCGPNVSGRMFQWPGSGDASDSDPAYRNVRELLDSSIGSNPRSVKRLLNLISLTTQLALEARKTKTRSNYAKLGAPHIDIIVVIVSIQTSYELFFKIMAKRCDEIVGIIMAIRFLPQIIEGLLQYDIDTEEWATEFDLFISENTNNNDPQNGTKECELDRVFGKLDSLEKRENRRIDFINGVRILCEELQGESKELAATPRFKRNLPRLATLLFKAVDHEGGSKGFISPNEANVLRQAMSNSQTTSMDTGEGVEISGSSKKASRVGFFDLLQEKLIDQDSQLVFVHTKYTGDDELLCTPLFEKGRTVWRVRFKDKEMNLTEATRQVFVQLGGSAKFSESEVAGIGSMAPYWKIRGTDKKLDALMREYREKQTAAMQGAQLDIESEGPSVDD